MSKQELLRQIETLDRFEESFSKLIRADVGLKLSTIHDVQEKIARKRKQIDHDFLNAKSEDEGLLIAAFIAPLVDFHVKPPITYIPNQRHKPGNP